MSLRDHPFAHTGLKLVSVALAVLLWMMVSSQRASVERGLRIPLELQNLPENLEMVEPPQESVDVRVRGTADALGRIAAGRSRGYCRSECSAAGKAPVSSVAGAREGALRRGRDASGARHLSPFGSNRRRPASSRCCLRSKVSRLPVSSSERFLRIRRQSRSSVRKASCGA